MPCSHLQVQAVLGRVGLSHCLGAQHLHEGLTSLGTLVLAPVLEAMVLCKGLRYPLPSAHRCL